jgi:hypothetical protein
MAVYEAIAPVAVLLVEAEHRIIHDRKRDGEAPPVSTMSKLAARERECAQTVCAELRIPMWTVSGDAMPEEA